MGGIWKLWELGGNYGRNVGIVGVRWELWEECGNYERNVGIVGDTWELWEICGNYGSYMVNVRGRYEGDRRELQESLRELAYSLMMYLVMLDVMGPPCWELSNSLQKVQDL